MATSLIQSSFTAGEISPALYGRTDLAKWHVAASTARNSFVNYRGGLYSRAGTPYVLQSLNPIQTGDTGTPLIPRLITFQFSITQGYVLELGVSGADRPYMRFFSHGAPIAEDPLTVSGATQADPCELTVTAHGWSTDDWVTVAGINGMTPLNGRTFLITVVNANTISLRNLNGTTVDASVYPAYISGGTAARIYVITTPWRGEDLPALKSAQSADVMSFTHPDYAPFDLVRVAANNWTLTATVFDSSISPPGQPTATATANPSGATSPPTLPCAYAYVVTSIGSNGEESEASPIANVTDSVDMAVTAGSIIVDWPGVAGAKRYNIYRAPPSYNTNPGNTTNALPVPVGAIFSYVGTSLGLQFVDTNITSDTSQSPPRHNNPFARGAIDDIEMTAFGAGYTFANVTIISGTGSGFVGQCVVLSGQVMAIIIINRGHDYVSGDSVSVTGDGGGATADVTIGPLFGIFPSVVSYFQQRRGYFNTHLQPDTYFFSKPAEFTNFDRSIPSTPNDAITGTPWSQQVNGIQWAIQMTGGLVVLTGLGGWQVTGAGGSALNPVALTPTSQQAQAIMFNGVSPTVPPIRANNDILYVQSKGSTVRDIVYNYFTNSYSGTDQTILSSHLFSAYDIREWAWCEEPWRVVWTVRCDGVLLCFTYMKEQEVFGWTRHDTQGRYVSITSVTEPPVDAMYCIVERTTHFGPVYFIERMDDRIWPTSEDPVCVDCSLQFPQLEPGISISSDSIEGAVNFTADDDAFPTTSVGSVLRIAGGIATISSYTDARHIGGTWVLAPTQVVPA